MKKWYMSKTLWVNALAVAGMITEYLVASQIYSPEIHVIVLAVINMILRLVTNTGVTK